MGVSEVVREAAKVAGAELGTCLEKCSEKTVVIVPVIVVVVGNKLMVDREWDWEAEGQ